MTSSFVRDGCPWDAAARLQKAVATVASRPRPVTGGSRPDGPSSDSDLVRSMAAQGTHPWMLMQLQREYPDITAFDVVRSGPAATGQIESVWVVTAPDLVVDLLRRHAGDLHRSLPTTLFKTLVGDAIVTSDGMDHDEHRRLLQPGFAATQVAGYRDATLVAADRALSEWSDGDEIDSLVQFRSIAAEVITSILTGIDAHTDARVLDAEIEGFISHLLPSLLVAGGPQDALTPGSELNRQLDELSRMDTWLRSILDERSARPEGPDLLSHLLVLRDSGELSEAQVRDELVGLVFAAAETVGLNVACALLQLAQRPDMVTWLRAEIDTMPAEPTVSDYERMHRTRAVVQESMRMFPSVWMLQRTAAVDLEVGEWTIPQGATVFVPVYTIHRDPRWWTDPDEFRPQRWVDADGHLDMKAPGQPEGAWLPFGLGRRHCIGFQLAPLESALLLAMVLRDWSIELPGAPPTVDGVATLSPDRPALRVRRRRRGA